MWGHSQPASSHASADCSPCKGSGARERACVEGRRQRGALQSRQLLTKASFSSTAKFKDRVDILSNIAKAKAVALAAQGSKSEGECKKGQCCLPRFALQSPTFPALSTQGLAEKHHALMQIFCYYWSQMAAVIMQQKSIDVC